MAHNGPKMKKYLYSEHDFIHNDLTWADEKKFDLSEFDRLVRTGWDTAMKHGHFRYGLEEMQSRVVPGKMDYVLQLNLRRGIDRRKPEYIDSLHQPFDFNKFNFTKVKEHEFLFELCSEHQEVTETSESLDSLQQAAMNSVIANGECTQAEHSNGKCDKDSNSEVHDKGSQEDNSNGKDAKKCQKQCHLVMINVSPLEYGHILLVPNIHSCISQQLTDTAVRMSIEMMLLSAHQGFRIGFNSLCALASVNHQHVHAWYLEHSLYTECAPVKQIVGPCYEMVDMPTTAFVFQLHGSTVPKLTKQVYSLTRYLQDNNIAHNVFLTRGTVFGEDKNSTHRTIRVYIWPRKSVIGIKMEIQPVVFNVAVAELSGHIPMYVPDMFDKITEEDLNERFRESQFSTEEYAKLRDRVVAMFKEVGIDG